MVVDGQAVFRSGLAGLLSDDDRLEVVAVSRGGLYTARMCAKESVDVLVTDLQLPETDGLALVNLVRNTSPATRVLVLSSFAGWEVIPVLSAGASGFLLKDAEPEAITSAVVAVHLGEQVLCPEATAIVMGAAQRRRLTRREIEVMQMVGAGAANSEIAKVLQVREKTVRNYVSRLYRKLAVDERSQIAVYARHAELGGAARSTAIS